MKAFLSIMLLFCCCLAQADQRWGMAKIKEGQEKPSFYEYRGNPEQGINGIDYLRIYDHNIYIYQEYNNPVKLQYGYRISDKHIYVYDFDTNEERLAFDFTLSAGDGFCTYNGMMWRVDAVTDTLINTSFRGQGEPTTKRLLKVHSQDGLFTDQWLEGFGSFSGHLMIMPMKTGELTQVLWAESVDGCNLTRDISLDPLFTHDTGAPEKIQTIQEYVYIDYDDGTLTVETLKDGSPNREYTCHYRKGDHMYLAFTWNLSPSTDAQYLIRRKDKAVYTGLPAPESGHYYMHFSTGEDPSKGTIGTERPTEDTTSHRTPIPFLADNPIWVYKYEHLQRFQKSEYGQLADQWWGDVGDRYFTYYFLGGEKVINGKTYRMMGEIKSSEGENLSVSRWLPVREEDGIVYTIKEMMPSVIDKIYEKYNDKFPYYEQGDECILYNFNLQLYDFLFAGNYKFYAISAIDSYTLLNSTEIRVFKSYLGDYNMYEVLGFLCDNLYGVMDPEFPLLYSGMDAYANRLCAYYRDGQMLYKADGVEEGQYGDGSHIPSRLEAQNYATAYRVDPRHDEVMAYIQQLQKDNATSMPEVIADKSSRLYDLTGRRLTDAPKKGLYIKGGKKYVNQ